MAPETRIGLVVGLAFIICFAVILANRGRRPVESDYRDRLGGRDVATRPLHELGSEIDAEGRGEPVSLPGSGRMTAASSPTSSPVRIDTSVRGAPDDARRDPVGRNDRSGLASRASMGSGQALLAENTTPPAPRRVDAPDSAVTSVDRGAARSETKTLSSPTGSTGFAVRSNGMEAGRPLPNPYPVRTDEGRGSKRRLDRGATRNVSQRSLDRPPAGAATHGRILRRHTVAKGDTLSKIAQQYYGSRSQRIVTAIFEANRGVLSSPDTLRIGVSLVLPDVVGRRLRSANAASVAVPKSSGAILTNGRGFRWYQIKKSDRYISIARRELGDASRWQEIFELNKDKFPDPGRIREGVRIKLPPASAREGV